MRWKNPSELALGETRIVTKFLWIPKEIEGEKRWLETATWEEMVMGRGQSSHESTMILLGVIPPYSQGWYATKWLPNNYGCGKPHDPEKAKRIAREVEETKARGVAVTDPVEIERIVKADADDKVRQMQEKGYVA